MMTALRKLQLTELNILKKVITFCDDNNIPYIIMGGTLLGAVRHRGFIPWDDDIDIAMPREEYERFVCLANNEFSGENGSLKFHNFKTDEKYKYYFSRVTDESVKLKDYYAIETKEQNAWIDIFPLDGMPSAKLKRKIHELRLLIARMKFQYSQFSTLVSVNLPGRPWQERLLIKIGTILPVEKMFKTDKALLRLDKLLKKYPYESSDYAVNFMGAGKFKEMHKRSLYDNRTSYSFEYTEVCGVADYDTWLTKMYGDYMTPPPDDEKNKHFTEVTEENLDGDRDEE